MDWERKAYLKPKDDKIYQRREVCREEAAFGLQNLEKLREKKHLTVPQFNDRLGISKGHLHRVLAGYNQFGIKAWWQISKALGIPLGTLIGRDT